MWRKSIFLAWLMALLTSLIACGAVASSEPMAMAPMDAPMEQAEMSANLTGDGTTSLAFNTPTDQLQYQMVTENQTVQQQQRLIIRTGTLNLVVDSPETQLQDISTLAAQFNGWVVSSNVYEYSDSKKGEITIRVPAERFDEAMNQIKAMAMEVVNETSSGQDVTEEYVDLSSQLVNLEATAERVRGFLDEAKTVKEALDVNAELSRLEGQIETTKGRMQFLSQSAAFSTITVSLEPDFPSQPITVVGWRPEGVAKEAVEALADTLQGLADILIWLTIYFLPMGLILGVMGVVVFYSGRWMKRKVWG